MLSCATFLDRIYDEDCRRAMEAGVSAPPDIGEHAAACAGCGRAWKQASEDVRLLPGLLTWPAPEALERRLRVRLAEPRPSSEQLGWLRRTALWSAVGAAAALAAARTLPPELAGVGHPVLALAGASMAFVAGATGEALRRVARS